MINMRKRIPRLALLAAVLVLALALVLPTAIFATPPAYVSVNGKSFASTGSFDVYDMNSELKATYHGLGVNFTSQSDNVTGGNVRLYQVSSIRGTYLSAGTATLVSTSVNEGDNTILVLKEGASTIVLPTGVSAVATSGSALVSGSPLTLAAGGTRTITTTTGGVFTLAINRTSTTIGTFTGMVGSATAAKPKYQLTGSQAYGTVTNKTGTATGSPVKALAGSTTINVTGAGTFDVAVPYGMVGTAASGTATLVGSPVTLASGATTTIDTSATTGNVTITLHAIAGFNISGSFGISKAGAPTSMKGRFDGFIVTDTVNWETYPINEAIKLAYTP